MPDAPALQKKAGTREERWTRFTDIPLLVVALIFVIAYSWDVIGDLKGPEDDVAQLVIWVTWGIFVVDYIVKLVLAPRRLHWFFRHILDFLLVALPFARPLRLMRVAMVWTSVHRVAGRTLRGRLAVYVVGSALLLVYVASLAVLEAERNAPHSNIHNFGEAVWWSFVTITGVGYGDYEPVSFEGRTVAVGLMIAGIALIGVIAATLATWLISAVQQQEEQEAAATRDQVAELSQAIAELRRELADGRGDAP
ncbi:MAG: ion transporter [Microbacteriaceae bacterium]|jgi:voltage-gated potassium channel|nr:ion transporter [Microbacteriaceae bacterium]